MEKIINSIAFYSTLLPLISGFIQFSSLNRALKLYTFLILFAFCTEIGNFILASRNMNNIWLINSFQFIEFLGFIYLLNAFVSDKKIEKWFLLALIIYVPVWIYVSFFVSDFYSLNEKEKTLKGILIMLLAGFSLIKLSLKTTLHLYYDYRFWMIAAILSYFAVSVFIYAANHLAFHDNERVDRSSWIILIAYSIIFNILTAIGYLWYYRKKNFYTY